MNQEYNENSYIYSISGNFDTELQYVVNNEAKRLELLGDKNAEDDVLLFHYSTQDDISEFKFKP